MIYASSSYLHLTADVTQQEQRVICGSKQALVTMLGVISGVFTEVYTEVHMSLLRYTPCCLDTGLGRNKLVWLCHMIEELGLQDALTGHELTAIFTSWSKDFSTILDIW